MHLNLASTPLLFFTIALTILNLVNPALAIKKGDSGPEVVQLQKTLQAAGYFGGKATGFYGSVTRAAVKKFQADNNLKVDGIVGPKTLSALKGKPEEVSIEAAGKNIAKCRSTFAHLLPPQKTQTNSKIQLKLSPKNLYFKNPLCHHLKQKLPKIKKVNHHPKG
jgi:peptidoglycan hydrolase-like protein with peptidoglycan-binding domain